MSVPYRYKNRGSALITGLVVSTVLMVLCLSLLAAAYSMFLSAKKSDSDFPEREQLYSAASVFEKELCGLKLVTQKIEGSPDRILPTETGENEELALFWSAFMDNISTGFSGGLQGESNAHYYNLKTISSYKIIVRAYWTFPIAPADIGSMEGTVLHAEFMLYNSAGDMLVKTERLFRLIKPLGGVGSSTGELPGTGSGSGGTGSGSGGTGSGSGGTGSGSGGQTAGAESWKWEPLRD